MDNRDSIDMGIEVDRTEHELVDTRQINRSTGTDDSDRKKVRMSTCNICKQEGCNPKIKLHHQSLYAA